MSGLFYLPIRLRQSSGADGAETLLELSESILRSFQCTPVIIGYTSNPIAKKLSIARVFFISNAILVT